MKPPCIPRAPVRPIVPLALMHFIGFVLCWAVLAISAPGTAQTTQPEMLSSAKVVIELPGITADAIDVFVDDFLVSDFASVEGDQITVTPPFADTLEQFTVSVEDRATGDVLFSRVYAIGRERVGVRKYIDDYRLTGSFQDDLVFKPTSREKPPGENFETSDWANDFFASGSGSARKGRWTVGIDGEIVGTDDDLRTLRQDGSKVDISHGLGYVSYEDDIMFGQLSVGDVVIPGNNTLVSNGFRSRGILAEAEFFDGRIRLSGGNAFGVDILGTQEGVIAFEQDNRRTALNVDVEVYDSKWITVDVSGGLLDVERPSQNNFNVGEVINGEKNTIQGIGFDLGIWEDRIRHSSRYGWSNYETPEDRNFENDDVNGEIAAVGVTKGRAETHRTDVTAYSDADWTVRAFGGYSIIDLLYVSVESFVPADRETREFGASIGYGPAQFSFSQVAFDNNV